MTAKTRLIRSEYLRAGCKSSWNPLVSTNRTVGPRSDVYRKHGRRERRRAQKAKLDAFVLEGDKKEKSEFVCQTPADCLHQLPVGAMAPSNTTQYLMSYVYEDQKIDETLPLPHETPAHLYSESLSPRSVSSALDSYYEGILAFQMRDFEELYGPTWNPE